MGYIERGQKGYLEATAALFAGAFVTFAVLYTTQPIMPELSRQFGVTPATSSLSLSFATFGLAISMLWVSGISDAWGRKRMMTVSLISCAVLSILLAFAPDFRTLLMMRAVQGVALAGFPSIAMAYINEEFHPKYSGAAMGLYVSGTSIGGMVGRIITGALTDAFSWRIAVLCVGILSALLALYFIFTLPLPRHFKPRKTSFKEVLSKLWTALVDIKLIPIYVVGFLLMGSFVTMYNYISYRFLAPPFHLSQTVVGFIFVIYLTGTFSSTWMGRWSDRHGRASTLLIAVLIAILGAIVTLSSSLPITIVGLAVFTFGFFGAHAVASSWVGARAVNHRAQASSLYLLFYYTGSSVAGAVGGLFWMQFGWQGVVSMLTVLLVLAVLIAVYLLYSSPRKATH